MNSHPNVLLLLADQWRAQSCGYAGNSDVRTPHIDALAAASVNCHLAANGCPVCTPARASLLTGLLPDRHGLFLNDAPLDPRLPSIGKHFSAAGYDTAWVGKWHVDGHGRYAFIPPERRHGFQYWKALECTHDYNHSRYFGDDPVQHVWPGYDAEAQTDDLIDWLRHRQHRKPFMAALSWGPPHNPFQTAPTRFRELYDADALPVRDNVPADKKQRAARDLAGYYAHCLALDEYVARMLKAIDELGLAQDTIVVFTSDHGDMLGSHGLWEKQGPWDESIRVPFLIRGPGLRSGTRSDVMIEWIDLWPTLCGLCDLPRPEVQGRDLSRPLLTGTVPEDNACFFASYHTFGTWAGKAREAEPLYGARESRGIRTERHTYVIDRAGPWLLYDNHADPLQERNLAHDPAAATLREELSRRLAQRMRAAGDAFPAGPELIARWGYTVDAGGTIPIKDWLG